MDNELKLTFLSAALGQLPQSLRFIYAWHRNSVYYFDACLEDNAPDAHVDAVSCISTEMFSSLPGLLSMEMHENIEKSSTRPWKIGDASDLMFLRYGELEGYD